MRELEFNAITKNITISYPEKPNVSNDVYSIPLRKPTLWPASLHWIPQGFYGWRNINFSSSQRCIFVLLVLAAIVGAKYSLDASMIFGLLSYEGVFVDSNFSYLSETSKRVIGISVLMFSSLIVNVPTCFLYLIKLKDYVQKCRQMHWFKMLLLLVPSISVASMTTLSSISLASLAVISLNIVFWLVGILTVAFLINTFTTRIGGTLDFLLSMLEGVPHWFLNRLRDIKMYGKLAFCQKLNDQEKLTLVKRDLDQYGQAYLDANPTNSIILGDPQIDIGNFYKWLKKQKTGWLNSLNNWGWLLQVVAFTISGIGLGYFSWSIFFVFLAKTADGLAKSQNFSWLRWMGLASLSDNYAAVVAFALSNQIFYMINAITWLPVLVEYWNVSRRIDDYNSRDDVTSHEKNKSRWFSVVKISLIMFVVAVAAWFSGEGYGRVMIQEVKDGFEDAPIVDTFLSRAPNEFPIFAPLITLLQEAMSRGIAHYLVQFFAGLGVNLVSVLKAHLREYKYPQLPDEDKFINELSSKEFLVDGAKPRTLSIQESTPLMMELETISEKQEKQEKQDSTQAPVVHKEGSNIFFPAGVVTNMWKARKQAFNTEKEPFRTGLWGSHAH